MCSILVPQRAPPAAQGTTVGSVTDACRAADVRGVVGRGGAHLSTSGGVVLGGSGGWTWAVAMSSAAAGVFISYRRQEASWLAAWLHDRLVAHFGEARVFLDIDWIKPGVDFMQVIIA